MHIIRAHLVHGLSIPLGKGIAITTDRGKWNGIVIHIPCLVTTYVF